MTAVLCLKGWERFQHYKDRDPPWVKLYRDLLTTESWVLGTDVSRLVQVASILLAARYNNKIPYHFAMLRKVACLECSAKQFDEAVVHLSATSFLEVQEVNDAASNTIAPCASVLHGVYSEQSRAEGETEQSRADTSAAKPPTRRHVPRETSEDPEWMLNFKLAYPERSGDKNWRGALKAANARVSEGHSVLEFVDGARRYATFCEATGKVNTEYVQQPSRFLGPSKPFLQPWTAPAKPENAYDRIMRLNGGNDESRVIEHENEFPAIEHTR